MVVGVLRLTLYIHGASSLKDKRQVLRKVTDRLRSRFNVSVAEVGENDVWQKAVVGICAVANDHRFVNEVLDKCVRDVGGITEIIHREMEIETYSEMFEEPARAPRPAARAAAEEPQAASEEAQVEGFLSEDDFE